MKRILAMSLSILFMSVLILVGCNKAGNQADKSNQKTPGTTSASQISTDTYYKDNPITVTQNWIAGETEYPVGQDPNNNTFGKWAKDKMGITLQAKWIASDGDTDDQKLNLGLVSGELPDLIQTSPSNIYKLAQAGRVIPIKDLFDKYASPLGKFLFEEYNKATNHTSYLPFTYNGKVYGLPFITDVWAAGETTDWIRKDILDTLGKKVPTTLDEYEDVLKAYKEKYPNGVGHHMEGLTGMETAMYAHGAFPGTWLDDGKGNLVFGSIQPEVKQGLATLRKWYANGWIDKEFVTVKDLDGFIRGNELSARSHWSNIWWAFPALSNNVKKSEIYPITVFQGPENKQAEMTGNPVDTGFAISAKMKHPEAIIYLFNEYAESYFRGEKDLQDKFQLKYKFAKPNDASLITNPEEVKAAKDKNKDWRLVAQYKYDQPGPGYFNEKDGSFHTYMGIIINERAYSIFNWDHKLADAYFNNKLDLLSKDDRDSFDILPAGMSRKAHLMNVRNWEELAKDPSRIKTEKYLGPPTKTMVEKNAYLRKLQEETFDKIIMGTVPLDQFDTFVDEWKKAGGDQITQEVNDWFTKVAKS